MATTVKKTSSTPFPQLFDLLPQEERWPPPPFGWDHETLEENATEPCRLVLRNGRSVEGYMMAFEARAGRIQFRHQEGRTWLAVPFEQLRSVTLTQPLQPKSHAGTLPTADNERDFRIDLVDAEPLAGTTVGHVESEFGLFLFLPIDVDRTVERMFVPRSAYRRAEFGPTTVEKAATHWIRSPKALLEAIEQQDKAPVLPMGRALLNLGLATQRQIDRALAAQTPDHPKPLGQMLVDAGVVSPTDLEAALAHKMGLPLVDVENFPIDEAATRRLPLRAVQTLNALPLMMDGPRMVLAVDSPSRVSSLRTLKVMTGIEPVGVLARRLALRRRLDLLSAQDVWAPVAPTTMQPPPEGS